MAGHLPSNSANSSNFWKSCRFWLSWCCSRNARISGLVAGVAVAGCSPALDWRVVRPPDWPLVLEMPCRPSEQTRQVPLAGAPVVMKVLACNVEGQLYAVASADVGDPARVGAALAALALSAQRNVDGQLLEGAPAAVRGMTPHPDSRLGRLQGQGRDGKPLQLRYAVFAHGTRVFQATVLGPQVEERLSNPLFDSLIVQP